jgi:fructose-bisphosphate aldolase class I
MHSEELHTIAKQLVAPNKGILAADESTKNIGKKFKVVGVKNTKDNRRRYRQMFFWIPAIEENLSGVILHDETIKQNDENGKPFIEILKDKGIIPGIKVDAGAVDLPLFTGEKITEGLDDLRKRLQKYNRMGAHFAKWRAVITIGKDIPSEACMDANAYVLSQYAAMCQEVGIVPIVEPEVLMDGDHTIERCEEVTTKMLKKLFAELVKYHVDLKGVILKSNMAISGKKCSKQVTAEEVAEATLRMFHNAVPAEVAGIVFLSGGQSAKQATENLNAICKRKPQPWPITFSYARALQAPALEIWKGDDTKLPEARNMFLKRLKLTAAARNGTYDPSMEN